MKIAPDLLETIVEHARRDAPNECCGMVATRDGAAVSVHATENTAASWTTVATMPPAFAFQAGRRGRVLAKVPIVAFVAFRGRSVVMPSS